MSDEVRHIFFSQKKLRGVTQCAIHHQMYSRHFFFPPFKLQNDCKKWNGSARVARFFFLQYTKIGKIHQISTKYTKLL
jgi:hypothetical protein